MSQPSLYSWPPASFSLQESYSEAQPDSGYAQSTWKKRQLQRASAPCDRQAERYPVHTDPFKSISAWALPAHTATNKFRASGDCNSYSPRTPLLEIHNAVYVGSREDRVEDYK